MNWSIIIGVLVIIVLILIRFGQGDIGTFLARFQKSTGGSGSSQKSSWPKNLILIVGIVIVITILTKNGSTGFGGYSKTFEIEVATLQPHTLCGVRPGERKFTIPHKSFVLMNGENYEITSFVRVNGTLPNESFTVDSTGCTQVSFAFTSQALGRPINPQVIQIAFK